MPAFEEILDCLDITDFMLEQIQVKTNLLYESKYDLLFSVERVNELVLQGIPFREAYRIVGKEIGEGSYNAQSLRQLNHSHEGSIGNLGNELIVQHMESALAGFGINKVQQAVARLLV